MEKCHKCGYKETTLDNMKEWEKNSVEIFEPGANILKKAIFELDERLEKLEKKRK